MLPLLAKLLSWPAPALFPALDLARMAALDAQAAERLAAGAGALSLDSSAGGACCTQFTAHLQHFALQCALSHSSSELLHVPMRLSGWASASGLCA